MASHSIEECTGNIINDDETDYGSDFSPEEAEILLDVATGNQQLESEDNPIVTGIEHYEEPVLRMPHTFGRESKSPLFRAAATAEEVAERMRRSVEIDSFATYKTSNHSKEITTLEANVPLDASSSSISPDSRSPLERFRTQPKKALSVTDLVSPAWCELQYWYTLTRHGKKIRTPAMKQGSVIHKELEKQVHTTVTVDITTKVDAWGLRIWNVIQGLRTLRDTGQTRELEIWGVVDGLVVIGVIDELSYICPDTELEDSLQRPSKLPQTKPPPDQPAISEFFAAVGSSSLAEAARNKPRHQNNMVYICDVKTRSTRSLPAEAAFRPTKMQLMLYHSLLSSLAMNEVDFGVLTSRYDLDPLAPFSDLFIAQVGSLNNDILYGTQYIPGGSQEIEQWSQDSMTTLLAHNSLSALWSLMITEFQTVLPHGAASLSNVLRAEYRKSDTGEIMGSKTFAMDSKVLKSYVDLEMQWWRGERKPQGVVVEEAFKCRSCEFADDCEWRLGKIEEAREKVRKSRSK